MPRTKRTEKLPEPPPRKEIGSYDVTEYPAIEIVDTGDGSIRQGWRFTERVIIVLGGEKIAADPGDMVYKLEIPGAGARLEVLQADVAAGMGYEVRELAAGAPAPTWPFPPAGTADTSSPAIGTQENVEERRHEELGAPGGMPDRRFASVAQSVADASGARPTIDRSPDPRRVAEDIELTPERLAELALEADRREVNDRGRRASDYTIGGAELDELESGAAAPFNASDELTDLAPGAAELLERVVRWARRQMKPFRDLKEHEQERELADLDKMITDGVRSLVQEIASADFPYVLATLEKVEFSDGIKGTITIAPHAEHRHELADHAKHAVLIVMAEPEQWTAGKRPEPQPDQGRLV